MSNENQADASIEHPGEESSNVIRGRLTSVEPRALRTFTPSLALISKSAGSYHFTPEGRKLADFSSGVLVSNLGHNPTRWWKRILDNLGIRNLDERAEFTVAAPLSAYNAATELEVAASERLLANMRAADGGSRMEQVLWAASGSEAIQKALWACMARDPERNMILATRGGFHGKKGLAGAVTGSETDKERDPRVRFISFPQAECDDLASRRQAIDLEKYRQELANADQELGSKICCLITEPYLGGGGSYHPQPEYLQLLQQFCRDHDIIFILDEIQSNFGRTGPMYAFTHYGIEPDIVCLGKGLGNGVPVSAAVGPAGIFGGLGYGEGSDTWSANPLSSAAVLATLDEFEQHDVLSRGQKLSVELEAGLQRLKETGVIAKVRGEGCVWGIECAGFENCPPEDVANLCVQACYRGDAKGRAIHLLGPLAGKVIRVSPPLVMTVEEAHEYLNVMYGIFSELGSSLAKS